MGRIGIALLACALLLGCEKQSAPSAAPPPPKSEFEWTGKLDIVLAGFMGEYGMVEGAMLGPKSPAMRVAAFLRDEGCIYQLRFTPKTVFVGAETKGDPAGLPVKPTMDHPRLMVHPESTYRVAGRFRKATDAPVGDADEPYFFPVDFEAVYLQVKSRRGFIVSGTGYPHQVDPEPARDLIVERLEVVTPATTVKFQMHGAIRRTYVFDRVLDVGWKDARTPSVTGTFNAPREESWSLETADSETVRAHLQVVAQESQNKYMAKAIEKRLKELEKR